MKCNRCIHYNVCLGYRNIDYDGDSNSCPYAKERPQGEECVNIKMSEEEIKQFKQMLQEPTPLYTITSDTFVEGASVEIPQVEWISVKERLPDKNGRYLVTNYNLVCLRRFSVTRNEFGYFDNTDESYDSRWVPVPQVTAWMPLPEPYKEEENDNDR